MFKAIVVYVRNKTGQGMLLEDNNELLNVGMQLKDGFSFTAHPQLTYFV